MYIQYEYTVCIYSMYIQYEYTVCIYSMNIQYEYTVCIYSMYKCIYSRYMHKLHMYVVTK